MPSKKFYIIKSVLNEMKGLSDFGETEPLSLSVIFDKRSHMWNRDVNYNLTFLRNQERYCNDILRYRGHIFLNEVFDMLGLPRTKLGQIVGWYYDENSPKETIWVKFEIFDGVFEGIDDEGDYSATIVFNVQGEILSKI